MDYLLKVDSKTPSAGQFAAEAREILKNKKTKANNMEEVSRLQPFIGSKAASYQP